MNQNHTGNIQCGVLKTANPALSNDINFFPGADIRWGLGYMSEKGRQLLRSAHVDRIEAAARQEDFVVPAREEVVEELTHIRLVIDDQHLAEAHCNSLEPTWAARRQA